jgi:hypothetical protein
VIITDIAEASTLGYWDGYIDNTIIELKTGSKNWTETQAKEHLQLVFYSLQHLALYQTLPNIILITANTKTAKVVAHHFKVSEQQLSETKELITKVWKELKSYEPIRTNTSLQSK